MPQTQVSKKEVVSAALAILSTIPMNTEVQKRMLMAGGKAIHSKIDKGNRVCLELDNGYEIRLRVKVKRLKDATAKKTASKK